MSDNDYVSIHIFNNEDFSFDWITSEIIKNMSTLGYENVGICTNPLEIDFLHVEGKQPDTNELKNYFKTILPEADLRIESYNIDDNEI